MITKPKFTGNKPVDIWHLECWEAEKAFQVARDTYDACPSDAPAKKRLKVLQALQNTSRRLNKIFDKLPASDPDDHRSIMGVLESIDGLTLKQAARCINNYLETAPHWEIVDRTEGLDRYDWYVDRMAVYLARHETATVPHREIVGRVYIKEDNDLKDKQPDRKSLFLGYGKHDDETVVINPETLAELWRDCVNACADLADKLADARAS